MIKINLSNNLGFEWQTVNNTCFKGYFFDEVDSNYYHSFNESLVINTSQIEQRIKYLNGFFSIVSNSGSTLFAAVDRVRSIPLFYSQTMDGFLLSDDASWIKNQIGQNSMDVISAEEFLLTGYVTGSETLFTGIKQLMAGEYLIYSEATQRLDVKRYFDFRHNEITNYSIKELMSEMEKLHLSVFNKLIKTLKGKQVVLPLSGGYDSRLIAIMLKKLNYENIVCFTYGKPGNKEAKVSKQVAEHLGYKWCFIPYDESKWEKCYKSNEFAQYVDYSSNYSSLAHIQDFLAVKELKEQGIIKNDAIFIPGHAYDFLAGSHIPSWFVDRFELSKKDLVNSIIEKHYNLWRWNNNKDVNQKIIIKINQQIGSINDNENRKVADEFENWDWKERQAKFICNSVRVYEYWGYEWRLPLWDNELIEFWSKIPMELRVNRHLFLEYVKETQNIKSIEQKKGNNISNKINSMKKKIPKDLYEELYRIKTIILDDHGWFGIYTLKMKLRYLLKKGSHINSGLVLDYLNKVKKMK